MSLDLKGSSSTDTVAYPTISLAEFMADLMGWKSVLKKVPTKTHVRVTRQKRASSKRLPTAKR